jgi:hypothetical protein
MPVARARKSRTEKLSGFTTPTSRASAPCKARWVWAGAVAKYLLRPRASCSSQRPAPRRCRNRRRISRHMCSGEEHISVFRLYRHIGKIALAAMYLRRVRVVGRSFSAGAQPLTHVCTVGACGKKNSAWASGGPAGGSRVAACLRRWRALPQRAARRKVQKPKPPCWLQIAKQNFKFSWARLFQKRGSSPPPPPPPPPPPDPTILRSAQQRFLLDPFL